MRHLSDGILRRLIDEPFAVPISERVHVDTCLSCKGRLDQIAHDARAVSEILGSLPRVNRAVALHSFHRAVTEPAGGTLRRRLSTLRPNVAGGGQLSSRPWRLPAVFAMVAAAVLICALTPAGSVAHDFLTAFQPTSYSLVPVTTSELQALPNLSDFGLMTSAPNSSHHRADSAVAAGRLAGMHVAVPAGPPPGVPLSVTYDVLQPTWTAFEFSSIVARASVARTGHALPPMPAQIDHSSLRIAVGPVVLTRYGPPALREHTVPALVVVQAPRPLLTSSGAPVTAIEQYLLALPGVSPQLREQIKAIGDPSVTLPIPIPIEAFTADKVTVQGVPGLAFGDSTNLGSGVLWQKNGMVYAVAGAMPESQVVSIAESLR